MCCFFLYICFMAYTPEEITEIFNSICDKIIEGQSVKSILREDKMPSSQTFWKWLKEDEEKSNQYARAKELYAESVFEDIILIADGTDEDVLTDEDGIPQTNYNIIQRDRLRIDARKWHLSKLNPKKYGEKMDLTVDDKRLSKEEREQRILELKSKIKDL